MHFRPNSKVTNKMVAIYATKESPIFELFIGEITVDVILRWGLGQQRAAK